MLIFIQYMHRVYTTMIVVQLHRHARYSIEHLHKPRFKKSVYFSDKVVHGVYYDTVVL